MQPSRLLAVGVFVIGGLLLFGVGIFMIGERKFLFQDRFEVYAEFANLAGLQSGAKVRVAGMDAGEVSEIQIPSGPPFKFQVRLMIREDLHPLIRTDSTVAIQTDGLVGGKVVQISTGSADAQQVEPGAALRALEPFELSNLLAEIRETVLFANQTVEDVQLQIRSAMGSVVDATGSIIDVMKGVEDDVQVIADTGVRITATVESIVKSVDSTEGTIGRLLKDDEVYRQLQSTADQAEKVAVVTEQTVERLQRFIADVESSQIVPEVKKAVQGVTTLAAEARNKLEDFGSAGEGGSGLAQDLRLTLQFARQAMLNLAEDTEALKRSFFFRGFFRDRGFYSLEQLTVQDYRDGALLDKDRRELRHWLRSSELFQSSPSGGEVLSEAGKQAIDAVMAQFLRYAGDSPLIVEGYASGGSTDQNFLQSQQRAILVRDYLLNKFRLRPNYTGFMPMGERALQSSPDGERWDGVALILIVDKSAQPQP